MPRPKTPEAELKAREAARMRLYRRRPEVRARQREYARKRRAEGHDRAAVSRYRKGAGTPTIYFIQQGQKGPVKIGFTSKNVAVRQSELQVGNPERLFLLKAIETTREIELEIHRHFQHLLLRGEWFAPSPELLKFINNL